MNRRIISLIMTLMLVLSVPFISFAVTEEPSTVTENTTIVDISGIEEGQAPSDELLVLVDEGTSKKTVSGIAQDAGASLDNISTLGDGTKLAKVTLEGDKDAKDVAEEIAADDAVLIVQPNYMYHLEGSEDETSTSEESSSEASSSTDVTEGSAVTEMPESESASNGEALDPEKETTDTVLDTDEAGLDASSDIAAEDTTSAANTIEILNPESGDTDGVIKQWYLGNTGNGTTKAESAWSNPLSASQSDKVIVAVIDTGAKLDHTDLKGNIIEEKCVSFNYGKKGTFTQWDGSDDEVGHGTHVCGLIAASANDNYGMKGIANDRAKLIVIDANVADDPDGGFTTQDTVLAINYAVDNGADIVNLSIGALYKDYLSERVIQDANDKNVLVVCAAGNKSTNVSETPGDANAAISVMAHDSNGDKGQFTNYGVYKDVSAPGVSIISSYIGTDEGIDYYKYVNGTSMASPLVAGIAALIKSENPNLKPREIKNYIYTSTGDIGFDGNTAGFGKVNALTAIKNVKETAKEPSSVVLNSTSLTLCPQEEFFLEYAVYPGAASTHAGELKFRTSDPDVAMVDKNGKVTAVGPGSASITAMWGDVREDVSETCNVFVADLYYENFSFPGSQEKIKADYSSFHKLRAVRIRNGSAVAFEGLAKGYKINVSDIHDYVNLKASSSDAIPVFRVYGPDGKEVSVTQRNTSTKTTNICTAGFSPLKTGEYKIQLLFASSGSNKSTIEYSLYTSKSNDIGKAEVAGVSNRTYTGRAHTQSPVVKFKGDELVDGTDYVVSYSNNVNAGTATMTVTGLGDYKGSQDVSFKINKAGNGLSVAGKTYKIKRSKVKKKARNVAVGSLMTIRGANGALRYAKVSGSKKLSINAYTGAVKIKKKTKKGTYKMKVRVTALGDANHNGATRQVTINVKVK